MHNHNKSNEKKNQSQRYPEPVFLDNHSIIRVLFGHVTNNFLGRIRRSFYRNFVEQTYGYENKSTFTAYEKLQSLYASSGPKSLKYYINFFETKTFIRNVYFPYLQRIE